MSECATAKEQQDRSDWFEVMRAWFDAGQQEATGKRPPPLS
jgi:hypothetical protein